MKSRVSPAGRFHFCLCACVLLLLNPSSRAATYLSNDGLSASLKTIADGHPEVARGQRVTNTLAGNPVWLVELGVGSEELRRQRPALLVVGGIEGNDLVGTVSCMDWIQRLAGGYGTNEATKKLLTSTTIYLFPRVNPDGAAHFFAQPRIESARNDRPIDEDHDGLVDEDPPDDLNGDGLISWMRVEDPNGEYILDPADSRLLIKSDPLRGERGAWRYLSEGRDDDHDEEWNEDGVGGVNPNRNFPFGYEFFAPWAGRHQVSEPETRALAEFVVDHPNIGIVFTFGQADNLVQTPKSEAPKRPPTTIRPEDVPYYRELGKAYRDALGLKKELSGSSEPGTFSDWIYFHRGRLSLAAQPWNPALQLEMTSAKKKEEKPAADSGAKDKAKPDSDKADKADKAEAPAKDSKPETKPEAERNQKERPKAAADNRNEQERAFLKWVDEHAPESVVKWTAIEHPDFPGKKVEVGGFASYARTNPPEKFLGDLTTSHGDFLTALAEKLSRVGIRKHVVKTLSPGVYDLTIEVENTGYLPTSLSQGETTQEVYSTRVTVLIDNEAVLSGSNRVMLGPIPGSGGMKEVRLVIHARNREEVEVEVVSMLGGSVRSKIKLAGDK